MRRHKLGFKHAADDAAKPWASICGCGGAWPPPSGERARAGGPTFSLTFILIVSCALFLGFWLAEQIFWILVTEGMNIGVAFGAHIGGFLFGAIASIPLKLKFPSIVPDA